MGVAKIGAAAAVVLLAALILNNCTEKKYINQPITDSVHIQGTVRAWRCGVGDLINNRPWDPDVLRFSLSTGEPATVTFIRDNGFTSVVETDDSSDIDLYLSAGSHKVVVETGYSYPPDTFDNVQLRPGDTTLVLDIVYAVMDPLNINCVFSYDSIDDTLSTGDEWAVIRELNQRSYVSGKPIPALKIEGVSPNELRRVHQNGYTPTVFVYYLLPVNRESYGRKMWNVSEAAEMLWDIIDKDATGFFPDNFSLYANGGYICMAQQ